MIRIKFCVRAYGVRCENLCPPNFYGPNCNVSCLSSDSCSSGHYTCDTMGNRVCKPNWLGTNCNAKTISPVVDPECPSNILSNGGCYNGGTCFNKGCCCAAGFTGPFCRTQIDNCVGNSCANNATCVNGINSYSCACPTGYTGQYCQISLNPCQNNPCNSNGICAPSSASATGCNCLAGMQKNSMFNILFRILTYI